MRSCQNDIISCLFVSKAEQSTEQEMVVALATVSSGTNGSEVEQEAQKSSKRTAADSAEDVYLLDASKEGNVGRFINVCGTEC